MKSGFRSKCIYIDDFSLVIDYVGLEYSSITYIDLNKMRFPITLKSQLLLF